MQAIHETSRVSEPFPNGPGEASSDAKADQNASSPIQRDLPAITCFTPGTGIATLNGLKPVETLGRGDRVLTRDCGFQPIRWVGKRHVSFGDTPNMPNSLPVLIRAHALGPGSPERDIVVSPRHRILTTDKSFLSIMGDAEALIEASALVGQPGILCVIPRELTYIHVLFDQHEVILSDNLWSESFYLGPPAVAAMSNEQCSAIAEIFPQIGITPDVSPQRLARTCLTSEEIQKHYV